MTRAGYVLREKWAFERRQEETERRWPGYHDRHWAAGKRRALVLKRWALLLTRELGPVAALDVFLAEESRVRVVERPGGVFVVTARKEQS